MIMVRQDHQMRTLLCIILLRQASLAVRGQISIRYFTILVLNRLEDAQTDVSAGSLFGSTLRFGSVCVLVVGSF